MPVFDAGSVVESMDWDFTKYGGGKGTVPEPSDLQIERFIRKFNILVTTVVRAAISKTEESDIALVRGLTVTEHPDGSSEERVLTLEESLDAMKNIDILGVDSSPVISDAMLDLVAGITKGHPTKAQMKKLPVRVRGAFFGWLVGQLTNPESSAAAMRPSLALVNGG